MTGKIVHKCITDLGVAAFAMMYKYKVAGRKGRSIYFEVQESESQSFDDLQLEYLSSEFHRFDSCLMSLKKMGEMSGKTTHKCVTDLGAAAFIMMYKYKVAGRKGRSIYFEVEESESKAFEDLQLEYLSSEFHRFDSCLMSLKKMGEYIIKDS